MSYFLSPALSRLRDEANAAWPNRSKASDGWIGDASHSARKSDHNPDYGDGGIVRATDTTNDGIDVDHFIARAIADPRTAYVISRGRIWQNPAVYRNGGWRTYTGANKHNHHVHVSARHGAAYDRNPASWGLLDDVTNPPEPEKKEPEMTPEQATQLAQTVTSVARQERLLKSIVTVLARNDEGLRAILAELKEDEK